MLGKLLKHEFRATARVLPIVYAASGLAILLCFIFNKLNIGVLTGTTGFLSVMGIIACMIFTIILIISRYYKSMYSTEGYLGGTLPVSNNKMIASKAIVAFVWVVISVIVCVALLFAFVAIFTDITELFTQFAALIGSSVLARQAILFFMIVAVIEVVYFIAGIYFCITLSNTPPFQRMGIGGAFLIYVVIYMICSALSVFAMLLVPVAMNFTPDGIQFCFQSMLSSFSDLFSMQTATLLPVMGIGSFVLEIVLSVTFFGLTAFFGKKYASIR